MKTFISAISQKEFPINEQINANTIRKSIFDLIIKDHPNFNRKSFIAVSELNLYRQKYLSTYLIKEVGELTSLEKDVLKTIQDGEIISTNDAQTDDDSDYTIGQRLADRVAAFGGSWKFIIIFALFITIWITSNIVFLVNKGFDPYPFILLNLILSCLAATGKRKKTENVRKKIIW